MQYMRNDEYQQNIYLLGHYHNRSLSNNFDNTYEQEKTRIEESSILEPDDFKNLFALEEQKYNHAPNRDSLDRINDLFDREWTLRKLEMACVNYSHNKIVGNENSSFMLSQMIEELPNWDKWASCHLHKVYLEIYLLFSQSEKANLKEILAFMTGHFEAKDKLSFKNAYTLLLNYQIGLYNHLGDTKSVQGLLAIYEWGLEHEIYYNGKYISSAHYKNLVTLPLKLHKQELAYKYLHSLKEKLAPGETEEIFRYCQGFYYYQTHDFHKALKEWGKEKFSHPFNEINARIMSWQIHYERAEDILVNDLEATDLLSSLIKLIPYVKKIQRISEEQRTPYINRLSLYKQLMKVKNLEDLEVLETSTRNTTPLNNQEWIFDMIDRQKKNLLG